MGFYRHKSGPLSPPRKPKPLRREGKVFHQVRLTGPEKSKLREQVYLRAKGFCEVTDANGKKFPGCNGYTPWKSGHLVHVLGVGAGGSDTEENTWWGCQNCHDRLHNAGGKPCPPKPRTPDFEAESQYESEEKTA